jgi:hypothetical protein
VLQHLMRIGGDIDRSHFVDFDSLEIQFERVVRLPQCPSDPLPLKSFADVRSQRSVNDVRLRPENRADVGDRLGDKVVCGRVLKQTDQLSQMALRKQAAKTGPHSGRPG